MCQWQLKVAGRWPLPYCYLPRFILHVQPPGPQLQKSLEHLVLAFYSETQEGIVEGSKGRLKRSVHCIPRALAHCAPATGCLTGTLSLFPLLGILHLLFPLLGKPFPQIFSILLIITSPERRSLSRDLLDALLQRVLGLFLKQSISRGRDY